MASFGKILSQVEQRCRDEYIPMLGAEKAAFLAQLVDRKSPRLIVECGTAIGYSGLWMASRLKTLGKGRIITVEINEKRARLAQAHFKQAGVDDLIEAHIGDAVAILEGILEPVDFLFLDNGYNNYFPCFQAIQTRLEDGALILADNVAIGAAEMKDYLEYVRANYESETRWFTIDLPWLQKDAMEVTTYHNP